MNNILMNSDLFMATVKRYMVLRHIKTKEALRAHTSVRSNKTFLKYLEMPELMPVGVFLEIMRSLNVPLDEQLALLKGEK